MGEDAIYEVLSEVFLSVFNRPIKLRPELSAHEVPGWDSFRQVELLVAVQARFGTELHIRDINGLQNVGDLVCLLARTLAH